MTDTVISFEVDAPPIEELARRVTSTLATHPWLVCEDQSRIAGYAYGTSFRTRNAYQWSAEVSAYVHPDFRRRGVARALYSALFEILRRQGFVRLLAGITLPNDASVRLHESMGFEALGVFKGVGFKNSAWHDVGWWQRDLVAADEPAEPGHPPGVLVPFAEIATAPWIDEVLQGVIDRMPPDG